MIMNSPTTRISLLNLTDSLYLSIPYLENLRRCFYPQSTLVLKGWANWLAMAVATSSHPSAAVRRQFLVHISLLVLDPFRSCFRYDTSILYRRPLEIDRHANVTVTLVLTSYSAHSPYRSCVTCIALGHVSLVDPFISSFSCLRSLAV